MTPQEQQMIQSLADRINNTTLNEKDPDAEQFLQQLLGQNPDAVYILAQTNLVQQYALEQAQKRLADARTQLKQLQQQAQQPRHSSSFLGNLLGLNDSAQPPAQSAPPPLPPPQYAPVPSYGTGGYGPPQPFGQPQYAPPQYGGQYAPQSGGFLRSAMQTATGVAAGALAFEGIESLLHGFGGPSYSSGFGGGGGRPEEVINNYYGDASPAEHHEHLSSDIEDRRHDSSAFESAADHNDHHDQDTLADHTQPDGFVDNSSPDTSPFDDNSFDDNSADLSSFDGGGGSDSGGGFDDSNS